MRSLLAASLFALTLAACTDAAPCTNCPPVDGTYAVSWADGGTVSSADGGCTVTGPRFPTLTLAERASNATVTTTLGDVTLGGTLYDTYEMVLTGSSSGTSYRLRALVIPRGTSVDGGIDLDGTFTTRALQANGDQCSVDETFTAQRVSR